MKGILVFNHTIHLRILTGGTIIGVTPIDKGEVIRYSYDDNLFCLTYVGIPLSDFAAVEEVLGPKDLYLDARHIVSQFICNHEMHDSLRAINFREQYAKPGLTYSNKQGIVFRVLYRMMDYINYQRKFDTKMISYHGKIDAMKKSGKRY